MSIQGKRIIWESGTLAWAYATLRDHLFGTVHWDQVPLFVGNKAIAALSLRPLGRAGFASSPALRHELGLVALALVFGNRRAAKTDSSNKFHS